MNDHFALTLLMSTPLYRLDEREESVPAELIFYEEHENRFRRLGTAAIR
jgi:hypothetical protein